MKRSEMLKKLYDAVDKHAEINSSENLVDYILNKCETLGMVYCKQMYLGDLGIMTTVEGWEDEDEEK